MKTAVQSLSLLIVFTIVCSFGGVAIGWFVGRYAPSYYRGCSRG